MPGRGSSLCLPKAEMSVKRRLHQTDALLVKHLEECCERTSLTGLNDSLKRLKYCEDILSHKLLEASRDMPVLWKDTQSPCVLRIFARGTFFPAFGDTGAYYCVNLDGILIKSCGQQIQCCLSEAFQKISVAIDRKQGTGGSAVISSQDIEWSDVQYPIGSQATSLTFRIPGDKSDKSCSVRFSMVLSPEISLRFRASDALRGAFPHLPAEITEEELSVAVLQHVSRTDLLTGRDRRVFACDDALKMLLEAETATLSSLRSRLCKHLLRTEPVTFELSLSQSYTLEAQQAVLSSAFSTNSSAAQILTRIGGKVLDVDVISSQAIRPQVDVDIINDFATTRNIALGNQSQLGLRSSYILRELAEDVQLWRELQNVMDSDIATTQTKTSAGSAFADVTFPQVPQSLDLVHLRSNPKYSLGQPLRTVNSALHSLSSFLDVGCDGLFDSSQLWLQEFCRTLDNEQPVRTSNVPADMSANE